MLNKHHFRYHTYFQVFFNIIVALLRYVTQLSLCQDYATQYKDRVAVSNVICSVDRLSISM